MNLRLFPLILAVLMACPLVSAFDTVVIDAGHGGADRGGIRGQKVPEKVVTLAVAKKLQKALEAQGYKVVMTRTRDEFVSLERRAEIANRHPGSIFISIHCDAYYDTDANGSTYFYLTRSGRNLASSLYKGHLSELRERNMKRLSSRGLMRESYYVLRRTKTTAVLLELGFLTNPRDRKRILDEDYQDALVAGIAKGVNNYQASLGGRKKETLVASATVSAPSQAASTTVASATNAASGPAPKAAPAAATTGR